MFLPLGDTPNPRGVPVVNYGLLLANVAVYVLVSLPLSVTAPNPRDPALLEYVRVVAEYSPRPVTLEEIAESTSAYDLYVFRHGFRPVAPHLGALFYSLFLHAGLVHLAGNMLFLWIFGDNVEYRLGRLPYLLTYLGTGVAATLFHALFALDSPLPLVGASGAISGVLGCYFVWFPRNKVRLFVFLFPFLMDVILVPARFVLGVFILLDNLLPFLLTRGMGGGVAYGAHIGGFIGGLAIAAILNRREVSGRPAEFRRMPPPPDPSAQPLTAVQQLVANGQLAEAARLYFALDARGVRRILPPAESLALADWLRGVGQPRAALAVYRRHLRDYPQGTGAAEAHLGAGLVQLEDFDQPTPAYQHFLDALDLDPSPETAARVRAALDTIAAQEKRRLGGAR